MTKVSPLIHLNAEITNRHHDLKKKSTSINQDEKQVLVILPHPDDEAFGFAGTMIRYVTQGVPVSHVCATLGEMGRNMGQPPIANRETLPTIRRQELLESLLRIGATQLYLLGRHDKMLEFEDLLSLTQQIKRIIEEVRPSVLFTFYPEYGLHQDHDALSRAVVAAVSEMKKEDRPRLLCRPVLENAEEQLGPPDLIHDVSDILPQKLAVIRAHASQTYQMFPDFEAQVSHPESELSHWFSLELFWEYHIS